MSDTDNHNPDGTFKAGNIANPAGNNGHLAGWQRYGDRLQKWLALPGEEIQRILSDPVAYNKLSSIDIACVRQAASIIGGDKWLDALERGLDRIEGKAKQPVEVQKPTDDTSNMTREQKMLDTAKKIAFLLSRGIKAQPAVADQKPVANFLDSMPIPKNTD